jgi:branched-chain amino acid transport system permease protein
VAGLIFAVIGLGAVALGRDPNGLANRIFALGRLADRRLVLSDRLSLLRPRSTAPGDDGSVDVPLRTSPSPEEVSHVPSRG